MLNSTDLADVTAMRSAIEDRLDGLTILEADGDLYVYYDPGDTIPADQRFPFCTLMTGDRYDGASNLDRDEAAYRINVGVGQETYEARFGPAPRESAGMAVLDTGHDYTATDVVLPHPFYAPLHWVCVVNPGERTRLELGGLLAEAHDRGRRSYERRVDRNNREDRR